MSIRVLRRRSHRNSLRVLVPNGNAAPVATFAVVAVTVVSAEPQWVDWTFDAPVADPADVTGFVADGYPAVAWSRRGPAILRLTHDGSVGVDTTWSCAAGAATSTDGRPLAAGTGEVGD